MIKVLQKKLEKKDKKREDLTSRKKKKIKMKKISLQAKHKKNLKEEGK